jgi:hypothetical protein
MHEAALLVALLLTLAVPLHHAGMSPAVAFPIIRVLLTPLVRALQARLAVDGIGGDLLAVILAATLSLAVSLATGELVRVIRGRLKDLLAVAAVTIAHRRLRSLVGSAHCVRMPRLIRSRLRNWKCDVETAIEFSYRVPADGGKTNCDLETAVEDFITASPPMGWLLIPVIPMILTTF